MGKSKHKDDYDWAADPLGWDSPGAPAGMKGTNYKGNLKRCLDSHKPLKIGDYQIYGGSCIDPRVRDADVYIGFDHNMGVSDRLPWENPPQHVYFHITDGSTPTNAADFKKLVEWTALQLSAGKKVHAGCIGGHGRTGMFLAALVTHMTGEKDSIAYVRKHYCDKAVENSRQVDFLAKHFDITKAKGSKSDLLAAGGTGLSHGWGKGYPKVWGGASETKDWVAPPAGAKSAKIQPVQSDKDVWRGATV